MKNNIRKILFIATFLFISHVSAAISPLSISIAPPVQFPPSDYSITGARISALWGHHRDLYGIDIGGLGNITDQDFVGIGLAGIFNATHGTTKIIGLQLAGVTNINTNKTDVFGVQASLVMNYNTAQSSVSGLQIAAVNMSEFTTIYGLQAGIFNQAQDVYGFQIGIVNMAKSLHGIQIGLANFNATGLFKFSPILNIGF